MELKATDLMIGDYVRHKKTKDTIGIFEIDDDRKVINNEPDGYCSERNISFDEIEPILLTPKILEKNGFSQDPLNGHIFVFHEKSGEVIYYEYGPSFGLTVDNNLATIQDLKIRYVHEFQHILRLCGIEKEMVL